MTPAEELRYLILAIQREGNRLYAADLRPLELTPSQAEAIRVLADHQPLSMSGLGELLVCETGDNPSRLVDRLVRVGLINRDPDPADRRHVTLTLTPAGVRLAREVATVEARLHQTIENLIAGQPVEPTLALLRTFANAFPAGQALARRQGRQGADDGTVQQ
ncbi:MarR family winged helix-turn-helix transcriptional regulator [Asanoa iriomotensis]|uniref:MarR family transcriptional regulator n=1 Tax=Asanoa iriomotensis TaxID=234613 RepID=A0ABQ4CCW6_9ACTN|nr:MarR family transcriptional regulator [Asanoa iriomotensis]GIF60602.1 MarR family transcriptional regulator [Asanoa iriomotensis]